MIKITSVFCFILFPLLSHAQLISVSNGFYNQKSTTIEKMQSQVAHNEEDTFIHLDVDNIIKYKGIEFGASYSYLATGISIFVKDNSWGLAGSGTVETMSHRIGLKIACPIKFLKIFKFSPYLLASYETSLPINGTYVTELGEFDPNKFTSINLKTNHYEVTQFVPSFGAQMNIRAYRKINLIFNLQYSFGSKVVSDLTVNYRYFGNRRSAMIHNTNTGMMMSFGIAYDIDYKHIKKSKDE